MSKKKYSNIHTNHPSNQQISSYNDSPGNAGMAPGCVRRVVAIPVSERCAVGGLSSNGSTRGILAPENFFRVGIFMNFLLFHEFLSRGNFHHVWERGVRLTCENPGLEVIGTFCSACAPS